MLTVPPGWVARTGLAGPGAFGWRAGRGGWRVMAGLGEKCRLALGTLGTLGQREGVEVSRPNSDSGCPQGGPGVWAQEAGPTGMGSLGFPEIISCSRYSTPFPVP